MHFSVFKFNYIALTFYSYTIKKNGYLRNKEINI